MFAMGKRFASFLSLFGVCTLLKHNKFCIVLYIVWKDHLLNVNISLTDGFSQNIYLYIFILGFF